MEGYHDPCHAVADASAVEVLRELLSASNLRPKDRAPLLSSEGAVSEALSGKRERKQRQIAELSKKFSNSRALFFLGKTGLLSTC